MLDDESTAPREKIDLQSDELIPPGDLKIIEHLQTIDRWKHLVASIVIIVGFIVLCAAILLPIEAFEPYRDKAWTLFTVVVSGAGAYVFSAMDDP